MSQHDLAATIGRTPSYVTKLEQDRYKRPSAETVSRLASALGVSSEEILGGRRTPTITEDEAAARAIQFVYEDPYMPDDIREVVANIIRNAHRDWRDRHKPKPPK